MSSPTITKRRIFDVAMTLAERSLDVTQPDDLISNIKREVENWEGDIDVALTEVQLLKGFATQTVIENVAKELGLGNRLSEDYFSCLNHLCSENPGLLADFTTKQYSRPSEYEDAWPGTDDLGTSEAIGEVFAAACSVPWVAGYGAAILEEVLVGTFRGAKAMLLRDPGTEEKEDEEFLFAKRAVTVSILMAFRSASASSTNCRTAFLVGRHGRGRSRVLARSRLRIRKDVGGDTTSNEAGASCVASCHLKVLDNVLAPPAPLPRPGFRPDLAAFLEGSQRLN